jgi:hypothetical protein
MTYESLTNDADDTLLQDVPTSLKVRDQRLVIKLVNKYSSRVTGKTKAEREAQIAELRSEIENDKELYKIDAMTVLAIANLIITLIKFFKDRKANRLRARRGRIELHR